MNTAIALFCADEPSPVTVALPEQLPAGAAWPPPGEGAPGAAPGLLPHAVSNSALAAAAMSAAPRRLSFTKVLRLGVQGFHTQPAARGWPLPDDGREARWTKSPEQVNEG